MSFVEVPVPSGGRVRLRTRLTHGQESEREDARAAIPAAALARVMGALASGARAEAVEDGDVSAVTAALRRVDEATLRVAIAWSDGVRDPDGFAIALPDDLDRLDTDDYAALVAAANAALEDGRADPNSSRGPSATRSSPAASAETSPATSGTPS